MNIITKLALVGAFSMTSSAAFATPDNEFSIDPDGTGAFEETGLTSIDFRTITDTIITVDSSATGGVLSVGNPFTETFTAAIDAASGNQNCAFCFATTPGDDTDALLIEVELAGEIDSFVPLPGPDGIVAEFLSGTLEFIFNGSTFATALFNPPGSGLATPAADGDNGGFTFSNVSFVFDSATPGTFNIGGKDLAELLSNAGIALSVTSGSTSFLDGPIQQGTDNIFVISQADGGLTGEAAVEIPAPAPLALLGLGLAGLGLIRRRAA